MSDQDRNAAEDLEKQLAVLSEDDAGVAAFQRDQALIAQEVKDNPDKPVAEWSTGRWVRLSQEDKDAWYARQAEHQRTLVPRMQESARQTINARAQMLRDARITPSEVSIYDRKEAEANRLLVDQVPFSARLFPVLAGEAKRTGKTPEEVATIWQTKAAERWELVSQIDQLRTEANAEVDAATTVEAVNEVVTQYLDSLQKIK